MIKIKPIAIPTRGEAQYIEIRVLPFNVPAETSIGTYYALLRELDNLLLDGNLLIPSDVVQQWGTDDSVIINYVLTTLGLEKAPLEVIVEEPIVVDETSEPQTN